MFCAQVFGFAVFILHFLRGLIGVLGQARVFLRRGEGVLHPTVIGCTVFFFVLKILMILLKKRSNSVYIFFGGGI